MRLKKLAFVTQRPMNVVTPLARELANLGVLVKYVCFDNTLGIGDPECDGHAFWKPSELSQNISVETKENSFLMGLRAGLQDAREDYWGVVQGSAFAFCRGYVLGRLANPRCPFCVRTDNVLNSGSREFKERVVKRIVLPAWFRCPTFMAPASAEATKYVQFFGMGGVPVSRIPYSIPRDLFRPASEHERNKIRATLGVEPGKPVVLIVAKLNDRETPWDLTRVKPELLRKFTVFVVGDGTARELFCNQLNMAGASVNYFGFQKYSALPGLYAAADIYLHGPIREVWGVSINEALESGKFVIASDRVGAALELVDGSNGRLYKYGDVGELELALDLASRLSSGSRRVENTVNRAVREVAAESVARRIVESFVCCEQNSVTL